MFQDEAFHRTRSLTIVFGIAIRVYHPSSHCAIPFVNAMRCSVTMSRGPNGRRTKLSSVHAQAGSIAKTASWLMLVISHHTIATIKARHAGMYLNDLACRCPTNLTVGRARLVTDLALS